MNDKKRDSGSNTDPHIDEMYEGIINDSTGSQSEQMGVRIDFRKQVDNPFKVEEVDNNGMKDFEKLTRGENVDIDE